MKKRTLIGISAVLLSALLVFAVTPIVNNISNSAINVYCVSADIKQGSKITKDNIKTVSATKESLPKGYFTSEKKVIGMYAKSDMYNGDFITSAKISEKANTAEDVFATLGGNKIAMSVPLESLAAGLSGNLKNGDIISLVVLKEGRAEIPQQLKYLKVITTTTQKGVDRENVTVNDDGSFDLPNTVTLLVNNEQAKILFEYEKNAAFSVALVYRGDEETAAEYLRKQDAFFGG